MTTLAPAHRSLSRARTSSARRAALYVVGLLSALPLLVFTLATVRALGLFSVGVGFLLVNH